MELLERVLSAHTPEYKTPKVPVNAILLSVFFLFNFFEEYKIGGSAADGISKEMELHL